MSLKIFWTPAGITLDQIGSKRFVDLSDGDTPNIRMNIRMLSIDTPEKGSTNRGIRNVAELDALFPQVADWIETGNAPIYDSLAAYLVPRLQVPGAATMHVEQGRRATEFHEQLKETFLRRESGRLRNLFVRIADQPFDGYGRLLAYVAPSYSAEERAGMTRLERATFNYRMVAGGWAAPFILFPSIPGELDLPDFREAARTAFDEGRGAWADPTGLTGYEFRSLERLAVIFKTLQGGRNLDSSARFSWLYRYCADMTTGELFSPHEYDRVRPYDRIFIWKEDVRRAVAELNLRPAGRLAATGG